MTPSFRLGWAMWGLGAAFYCYAFFQRVAPSVMVDSMMAEFGVGAAIAGMLSGLYFWTYAPMQIPIGLLLDRLGPRVMMTVFALVSAAGAALFAAADGLGMAYAGRALVGLGSAVTWVGTLMLAARWLPADRFALVTGLTLAVGMAGAVGGQAPLGWAVAAVGWRGTMTVAAVIAAGLAVLLAIFLRDGQRPQLVGKVPSLAEGLARVLVTRQTYVVGVYALAMAAPMLAFAGLWGVPFLMQVHGLTRAEAAFTTSTMLVAWGIGAPAIGGLSDRLGRRRPPLIAATIVSLAVTSAALFLPGLPILARQGLLAVMGLAAGGFVLSFAVARENAPAWAGGAALGVVNTASMAAGAIFQPLVGALLDLGWDGTILAGVRMYSAEAWGWALLTLPACHVTALLAGLGLRETHGRHPE